MVDNVLESAYLGQMFSSEDQASFTDLSVSKAIGKFIEMIQELTDQKMNMTKRTKPMGACLQPPPVYGTQSWYINEETIRKLEETCWRELLRQMVDGVGFHA